ncbi:MAG: uracil-DNA glycosylase [Planctomycetes bacterium]|nr:uracil-DNA glycosylase [Planctomycetota bacterium]
MKKIKQIKTCLELEKAFGITEITLPGKTTRNTKQEFEQFRQTVLKCTKCDLHPTRKTVVFGDGNTLSSIMFVGEAPGEEEDKTGRPFVGKAGQLLREVISEFLPCDQVYIANILKCRPPQNRLPTRTEIGSCLPYLSSQIKFIKPSIICCLGSTATTVLLGKQSVTMGAIRGKSFQSIYGTVFVTYHPSFLVRRGLIDLPIFKNDIKQALIASGMIKR